jgi:hypothetical protein
VFGNEEVDIKMPISRLLEKAKKLVESNRVEPLSYGVYNVIGDHGTYLVAQDHIGKWSCNCIGFINKARCSHVTAVMLLTKGRRRQKPRKS